MLQEQSVIKVPNGMTCVSSRIHAIPLGLKVDDHSRSSDLHPRLSHAVPSELNSAISKRASVWGLVVTKNFWLATRVCISEGFPTTNPVPYRKSLTALLGTFALPD